MKRIGKRGGRAVFAAALLGMLLALGLAGCGNGAGETDTGTGDGATAPAENAADEAADASAGDDPTKITFALDWTPNTNHTGLYVAIDQGYFAAQGLEVEVVQPPDGAAEPLVASGQAQFGVSFQDTMAPALAGEDPMPITAVAAVIQHNTSGIVSRAGEGMDQPAGMAGHKYATWDLPVELATVQQVVEADGGDNSQVQLVPSTVTDEVSALQSGQVDAIWVFEGWGKTACDVAGLATDYFTFADIDPVFDYYTPVIIANDQFLEEHPDVAEKFLTALRQGYEYAIADPDGAASILMKQVPELAGSADLIRASQRFLANQYQAEAVEWGVIDGARWSAFYQWLLDNQLVDGSLNPGAGFTNNYLLGDRAGEVLAAPEPAEK